MGLRIFIALLLVSSPNRLVHANDLMKVVEYLGIERSISKNHGFWDHILNFYRFQRADCMRISTLKPPKIPRRFIKGEEFSREALYKCAKHQMAWESRSKQDVIQLSMMELNGFYDSSEEFVLGDFDREFIDKVRDVYKSWKQSMKAQVLHVL